jgi:isopenicillin-N N-acyltransferase-like protein
MFPTLTLSGAARARGLAYGRGAAPLIRHSIASYARLFAWQRGMAWAEVCAAARAYGPVLGEYAPEVLEELRGIAEGSGRELDEILALNARTELLAGARHGPAHPGYAAAVGANRAAGVPEHGECTTVAALPEATAAGETLLAQTWDWTGDQRAACVVLRLRAPGQPEALTVTEAGIVAKIGLNSAGLALSLNILASLDDGREPGMPVHVLLRRLLAAHSVDEAVEIAGQARAGASSCVTVADAAGRAASLEITPGGIGVLRPERGLLVHTNHCVTAAARAGECPLPPISSSIPRFERARELLAARHGRLDRDALIAVLRDRAGAPDCICRHPDPAVPPADRVESVFGAVMDTRARVMYLAAGLPDQTTFEPLTLEEAV